MSQENVEIVRRHVEALNRRDLEASLDCSTPMRRLTGRGPEAAQGGLSRSASSRPSGTSLVDALRMSTWTPTSSLRRASEVVVLVHDRPPAGAPGDRSRSRGATHRVHGPRTGRSLAFGVYQERAEALEAAGLRE